jgi:hypothetical protein
MSSVHAFSPPRKHFGLKFVFFTLGVLMLLGCGKGKDGKQPEEPDSNETPIGKLTVEELQKDGEKYKKQWVIVTGRAMRVDVTEQPDGKKTGTVTILGDQGRWGISCDFEAEEWAKTPKLENGVRYEIQGVFVYQDFEHFQMKKCRYSGVSTANGPVVAAKLTADELIKDGAKYMDKFVQVKGNVGTGSHSKTGDSVTVTGSGNKFITCVLASGEFPKVLKCGRGVEIEIKGNIQSADSFVIMNDCTVVNCKPASPLRVGSFSQEFADNTTDAEKKYKDKIVTLLGKVESVNAEKIVLVMSKEPKGKSAAGYKINATFGPDWKRELANVKVGDDAVVSGTFDFFTPSEMSMTLSDCWLLPK